MNFRFRFLPRLWMVVPLCACGFLVWAMGVRARHADYVTAAARDELKIETSSPTGYAGGMRRLIVPEHNVDSYHWIAQTQQMFARQEWRVRHIDYENAPFGHDVNATSPYRWWLGLVAVVEQALFGPMPLGLAVERAAVLADPLLLGLLFVVTVGFVAWQFGRVAAALVSVVAVAAFPFAGAFLPSAPADHGLALVFVIWSVLPLLAGLRALARSPPASGDEARRSRWRGRGWFCIGGVTGGLGVWVSVGTLVPVLLGIGLGALLAAGLTRLDPSQRADPGAQKEMWQVWALAGGLTVSAAYLIEFYPGHLGAWQLRVIHPLYGIAWVGGGAGLACAVGWLRRETKRTSLGDLAMGILAIAALAAIPVAMKKTGNPGYLATDLSSFELSKLPGGVKATSLLAWLIRDGITRDFWATLLPVTLLLPAGWLVLRRGLSAVDRASLAVAIGPVLVMIGFACRQLSGWSTVDALLLVLVVPASVALGTFKARWVRPAWCAVVAALLLPGAMKLFPSGDTRRPEVLGEPELMGLIERDIAHWLARRAGADGVLLLAPPKETAALCYYGGLRGLATPDWENKDGFAAAVRIASATTSEEALELIRRREVTHIIIPSWDNYLDEFALLGLAQLEGSFVDRLHRWTLPPWLRPVPYQLPAVAGLEGQSVIVLEVVEDQDDAARFSRQAEYFVEMGWLDQAAASAQSLRRFPADIGALVARAQVEIAAGNTEEFTRTVDLLQTRLTPGADRNLPWDRRVSLALLLARAKRIEPAREQIRRCLAQINAPRIRSLTTSALYRLQVLTRAFELEIADPKLRSLARELLPADLRERLGP